MARFEKINESDDDLLPLSVLQNCRTVVEKQHFVTTGVMTHVEGDLFEVELHEYELFELGETVKLTVYSPAGIQSTQSIVFAKYEGAIALLQPPEFQRRFKERREHARVQVAGTARILHVRAESGEEVALERPHQLAIHDISLSGLGFTSVEAPYFARGMRLEAQVDIGFGFGCRLQIIRRERQENLFVCGAKMELTDSAMLRPLRAVILRHQVEKHAELRRESGKKRPFHG